MSRTWIRSMKENRTILFSTHFMEEADALSDRIVILSNGKIRANNTPMELKRIYGTGYKLIINTNDKQFNSQIFQMIEKDFIYSKIEMESDYQLIIQTNEQTPNLLIQLLNKLDLLKEKRIINNYGLANTTLGFSFLFFSLILKEFQ